MATDRRDTEPSTHIDIGGIALPRRALVEVLPDIDRFERHLADALAIDADLKEGDGSIPAYARNWSEERINAVVATLKEIGSLREQASDRLRPGERSTDDPAKGT